MWKVILALLWLLIEGTGLPLLSEGAFGTLGYAVHTGAITSLAALLVAWAVTVAGNTVGFFAIRAAGSSLLDRISKRWPSLATHRASAEDQVQRHLFLAMTVARFLGLGTFGLVLWLSGLTRVRWQYFLAYLAALDFVWVAAWLWGSRWLVDHVAPFFAGRPWWQDALFCAFFAGLFWAGHHLGRHHRSFGHDVQ